jgi:hypothetical protein
MAEYQQLKGHCDLEVYQLAYKLAMDIFNASKSFPKEEKYSLTDQIRRSSRSIAANIAEGFRKRQYPKMFVSKMSTQTAKPRRHKSGSTSPAIANIYPPNFLLNYSKAMRVSVKCSAH